MKVGQGFDVHPFADGRRLVIGGRNGTTFITTRPSDVPTYVEYGAADIGMVAAARHPEEDGAARLVEDRRHNRDVWQVRTAIVGRVQHIDVVGAHRVRARALHGRNTLPHRAQMDGHMRRVGDQGAGSVEDGAGKIQPLLHVDRARTTLQQPAHFFDQRCEATGEQLQFHRHRAARPPAVGRGIREAFEQQRSRRTRHRPPARGERSCAMPGLGPVWEVRVQDVRTIPSNQHRDPSVLRLRSCASELWRVLLLDDTR